MYVWVVTDETCFWIIKNLRRDCLDLKLLKGVKITSPWHVNSELFEDEKQRFHSDAEIEGPIQRRVDALRKEKTVEELWDYEKTINSAKDELMRRLSLMQGFPCDNA